MPLDSYHYQTTNNFKSFFDQENAENIILIIALIFLVIHIHIWLTRLLKNGVSKAKFDIDKRLYTGSTSLNWDDNTKIKKTIIMDNDDKDELRIYEKKIGN